MIKSHYSSSHSINIAGPVYDVVMTRKDDSWLVLIDTSECGKLEEGVRLRPFRETGDVAHLTQEVRATNNPRKI